MDETPQKVDHEKFVTLFSKYEGNIRAFVTSLLPNFEGVDEVMQESSLVMWRKFDQFDTSGPDANFLKWAFKIARFEVLKFRKKIATDPLIFDDYIFELLADEAEQVHANHYRDRTRALHECLKRLEPWQREFINVAYEEGVTIKQAAKKVGKTQTALYQALARIRRRLHRCIETTIAQSN